MTIAANATDDDSQTGDPASPAQTNANSVSSASFTPSIRRLINQEIAAAGDSSDDDVDRSLDVGPDEDSASEHGDEQQAQIQDQPYEQDGDQLERQAESDAMEQDEEEEEEEEEEYEEAHEVPIDPALVPLPETPAQVSPNR